MRVIVGSEIDIELPPALCWAYPAADAAGAGALGDEDDDNDAPAPTQPLAAALP